MLGLLSALVSILSVLAALGVVVVHRPTLAALLLCALVWLQAVQHLIDGAGLLAVLGFLLPGGLVAGALLIVASGEPGATAELVAPAQRWRRRLPGPILAALVGLALATLVARPQTLPRGPTPETEGLRPIDPGSPGAIVDSLLGNHALALLGWALAVLLAGVAVVLWVRRPSRPLRRTSP